MHEIGLEVQSLKIGAIFVDSVRFLLEERVFENRIGSYLANTLRSVQFPSGTHSGGEQ